MGNHYPQQPPQKKSSFPVWLIVLLATIGAGVLILPVLAVLSIYGVRKYIANAKTAEARNSLAQMAKDAAVAYETEEVDPLRPSIPIRRLCPSASMSVPASPTSIRGRKYQSAPSDWEVDSASNGGFSCLHFSMTSPQYYLYEYGATGASSPGDGFTATARGDLNGDGATSRFGVLVLERLQALAGDFDLDFALFRDLGLAAEA
jgi:type IV pilus assembly protein PilA